MANLAVPKGVSLTPGFVVGAAPTILNPEKEWPDDVESVPLQFLDTGIFLIELAKSKILPGLMDLAKEDYEALASNPEALFDKARQHVPPTLETGTYRGTQLALTKVYQQIEKSYESFMDAANFEPSMPQPMSLAQKKELFGFTDPKTDGFPPHLNLASNKQYANRAQAIANSQAGALQKPTLQQTDLFNSMRLAQLTAVLPHLVPKTIVEANAIKAGQQAAEQALGAMGRPDQGKTLANVEAYNKAQRARTDGKNDVFNLPNVGDIEDWYADRRFAQQFFTGPNPTTIELASDRWLSHFIDNATESEADQKMKHKIQDLKKHDRHSLYMQDYSYFRKAAGITDPKAPIVCPYDENLGTGAEKKTSYRYGVASVVLFYLPEDGQLQPLAIVIDWRGSAQDSVTIYNKELPLGEQREDWPWRYAKTCVQCSDWVRHEVSVHLTLTHFMEEATIVGAQRSFEDDHPVLRLLYPHWQKTLTINAGARASLVPNVIVDLIGFTAQQATSFILTEYTNFDFQKRYVPSDLKSRGFDPKHRNDKKFLNYAYARCIYSMWFKIHAYVKEMLAIHYHSSDAAVQKDPAIAAWCKQMQMPGGEGDSGGAGLPSFPTITTFNGLVDAVTMCIHLASPQHTAVNYLQNYYQSFVPNKPACLYAPIPATRAELDAYTEENLVLALPMNHPREWLLASHIPYLLSAKPGDKESLIVYAASKYHVYKTKEGEEARKVRDAAARFYKALADSEVEFEQYGRETWDSGDIVYNVLSPSWNAVSIVI